MTQPGISKILVPTDFSECSSRALDLASELAKRFNATLDLIHVWEAPAFLPPEVMVAAPEGNLGLASLARARAHEEIRKLRSEAEARGVVINKAEIAFGAPARTVIEHAEKNGHDLIITGTHGRTGLSHVLLGSVAERVVRFAKCSVFTVR